MAFFVGKAMRLILDERRRAEEKFPDQHLAQGTGPAVLPLDSAYGQGFGRFEVGQLDASELALMLKDVCKSAGTEGNPDTWAKVIGEEFGEYLEASRPEHVKAELVQLGAMVVRALEDILAAEE